MAKYQKYAEYKDSGVEWLGEIPSYWDLKASKLLFNIVNGSTPKSGVEEFWEGDITWVTPSDLSKITNFEISESSRTITQKGLNSCGTSLVPSGSLILSCRAPIGSLAITTKDVCTNQGCKSLVVKARVNTKFMYYFFSVSTEQLNILGRGTTFLELSSDELGNFKLPYPKINEQSAIANFLDHETTKIDSLIEKQQKLIELLKEKRQAVISHAVTKGLNPDVPMKDSGVEWLGQVPEHWDVTRAKFVSTVFVPQRNKPELNDIDGTAWVTMDDMKNKYIHNVYRYVSDESAKVAGSKVLGKGSVIASCVGNFGVTSINQIDVIINQQLQAFIPTKIKAEYLQSLVSISKNYFERIGTAATLVYVNQEGFQNLPILNPPYVEQVAICARIEEQENKYDKLIELGIQQINVLQERRTALISSAVTGKIDVRNWQNPNHNNNEAQTELSQ
ncbi:restriction endonuclease subunit S [Acinetobacter sp. YH12127]|uniref:restriction endonuclease subunit S n=1 Tax=Acinetobacter sp. YH12127 TaxID=2601112 RepID=UPI0035A13238